MDAFYILPVKLLDACLKVLPISNTSASAISVDDNTPNEAQVYGRPN
ncbi:hypothetical protein F441_08997 [Phytophthora nicotianae CJ01A1]|uniref:Uncharacterized protein n=4 Tax=Phytophthora nicotianae TaxID=4792 RepID=W2ZBH4_PHYNI|nr:hypothetical protein L915_08852 [Phytophthora nicotianae]ETL93057.1 hypothetical protein L917_08699 [Phytophthora nicotianae]ETO75272.1 hypothetical protein F444_09096 [Phytophthora nicotianae P1976]ETP16376.1 hypothetical protein F441_08997 [Phytophthora nicotianae CJ01A1]ETP44430.1 hypothetical protein F442_08969 [Phytophthora nicotianae P10297]